MKNLGDQRQQYLRDELKEENLAVDPIAQFEKWYRDAEEVGVEDPNGMTLATSTISGIPSARIVLLKGFSKEGFAFYTNYESQKGKELSENPNAALVFWYKELQRQIRIEGTVEKLSFDESQSYFHSRPRGSQIGAWASPQSQIITGEALTDQLNFVNKKFKDAEIIPLPDHWGGFLLTPVTLEFWQGREDRVHDRFKYRRSEEGNWEIVRLAP